MHILAKQYIDSKEVCSNYFFRGLNELYILVPESHVFPNQESTYNIPQ